MNILLITSLYPGYKNQPRKEITWSIHNFIKKWSKIGHNVKVIVPWRYYPKIFSVNKKLEKRNKYSFEETFYLDNVEITRLPMKKIPRKPFSKRIIEKTVHRTADLLRKNEFNPDVIFSHYADPSGIIAAELKKELNTLLIHSLHNSDISFIKRKPQLYKKLLTYCDGIVFVSKRIRENFSKFFSFKDFSFYEKIIPLGIKKDCIIDESKISEKSNREICNLITVCKLISLKNVDILIKAFSKLEYRKLRLTIVGDGPELANLKKLSSKTGLSDDIEFKGELPHEQVLSEMRDADLFVLVSSPETFGLVYLEAMASGCITIGSKGEGIDGFIVNGENGFLVEPGSTEALKVTLERILRLTSNEKFTLTTNALNTVKSLTEENIALEYLDFAKYLRSEK